MNPVISYSPVILTVPGRPVDLQVRVTAPATGTDLPVILLSHGHGHANNLSSLNGYAPIANEWAARGFVVVQPTHLSSRTLTTQVADAPGAPYFWRSRAEGHVADPRPVRPHRERRAAARRPGEPRARRCRRPLPRRLHRDATARRPDHRSGDRRNRRPARAADQAGHRLRRPRPWRRAERPDGRRHRLRPHHRLQHHDHTGPGGHRRQGRLPALHRPRPRLARRSLPPGPAPKTLLTVFGAEHLLGGIQGYDAAETTDENPERVTAIARLTAAYLHPHFHPADAAWQETARELATLAAVDSKPTS